MAAHPSSIDHESTYSALIIIFHLVSHLDDEHHSSWSGCVLVSYSDVRQTLNLDGYGYSSCTVSQVYECFTILEL